MFVHNPIPNIIELRDQTINGKRTYTTPEGNKYPSITTLLGHKEKPWLNDWRNMLGPKKADKETKRCADRGSAVHELAEQYLKNNTNFEKGHDIKYRRLFNQIKLRLNKISDIRAQEIALYSDTLKIAGRCDCIASYEGIPAIIDFKTSNNNKDEEMVYDYFLQCTAYSIMLEETYDIVIDNIVVIIAVERGIMPLLYKENMNNYIEPLIERINNFYKKGN